MDTMPMARYREILTSELQPGMIVTTGAVIEKSRRVGDGFEILFEDGFVGLYHESEIWIVELCMDGF